MSSTAPAGGPSREAQDRAARLAGLPMLPAAPTGGSRFGDTAAVREIWRRRELLGMLMRRELRARYKDSSLGFLWALARPLVQLVIYYVAIGRFLGAERAIPDFAIYVFTGLTLWQLFSETVMTGTASVLANAGIIKKIYLPRELFPLSAVGSSLINFAVQFTILVTAALILRGLIWDERLLFIPLSLVVVLVWGTALAVALSAVNVYLRDIQYLVEVGLLIGFWLSPIVYSWEMVTGAVARWIAELYLLNPMTLSVLGFQRAIWTSGADRTFPTNLGLRLVASVVLGLLALLVAHRAFVRLQRNFAQEM